MGRKTMLRVANAVSDGVDPRDWTKLKSKEILLAAETNAECGMIERSLRLGEGTSKRK